MVKFKDAEITKKQITVGEFEKRVYELEEIRIVIRAPKDKKIDAYCYRRKAASDMLISEYVEQRLKPIIKEDGVCVIAGNGRTPHGRTDIESVRNSYVNK